MPAYPFETVEFTTQDGYVLCGKLYPAKNSSTFLLIGSAFGVPNGFYKHFAHFMAQQGINVFAFDYRGIADSQQAAMPFDELQLSDWGKHDLDSAIQLLKTRFNAQTIHYLGHSCGGQIIGLAPSCTELNKIIIAASGVSNWRLWPGVYKVGMFLVWKLLFPIAMLFRRKPLFSSHLLGKVPVPRKLVKDWLHWARSDDYLFSPEHSLDLSNYISMNQSLLKVSVSDDLYAPYQSLNSLVSQYSNCQVSELFIKPSDVGLKSIGHFGLFKKKQEIQQGIWQPMLNFLMSDKA